MVGEDVSIAVLKILNGDSMIYSLNSTYIALISKKNNPTVVSEFQPICLYNVVYKLVSKVLTNWLKPHIHTLILPNQSAFILRRLMTDNIMIAHELLHSMKRKSKGRKETMAIKLDMAKAYDRVEWGYLDATLNTLGFSNHWRKLIMSCVSIISYLVLFNGCPSEAITLSRRLRQRDPLSPFFISSMC